MPDQKLSLTPLVRAARRADVRLRLRRVLQRLATWLPYPLIYALAALTFIKVAHPRPQLEHVLVQVFVAGLGLVALGLVHALAKRNSPFEGAQALDKYHRLADRVTNALSFSKAASPTPLMQAAIADGISKANLLAPRRAVPIRFPRDLLVSVALAAAVYGILVLEVRTTRIQPPELDHFQPMALQPADVELLQELSEQLQQETQDPEVLAAVRRFNQLIEDVAERRLDRRQIFQRLEQLERELDAGADLDQDATDESLAALARELQKSKLSKPLAKAFEEKNLPDAEKAMRELAERLKNKNAKVNKAELERLRRALESASKGTSERLDRLNAQRRELEEQRSRLLNKKQQGKPLSAGEKRQQEHQDRQLKRLDRQKKRAESAKKQLSELDKDLAKAAQELMKEMGDAPKSLESGAENINRMAQKEMSRKEKEALKKQLQEMRELLRQSKKGSKQRQELLEKFRQAAKGGQGKPGPGGQKPGEGNAGKGGQKPGQLRLGGNPGGPGIEVPVPGAGQSGARPGAEPGEGVGEGGQEWGTGRDGNVRGDPTNLKGQTQDVSAAGIDTGEGMASSEVVYGAAERGFRGGGYRKVFTDYKTVAEEVIESDEIPPGYKFYVRRYFQLIRPRE